MDNVAFEDRERRFKRILRVVVPLYILVSLGVLLYSLQQKDSYAALQAALALAMLLLPAIVGVTLRVRVTADCRLLYYLFSFFTVVVGSALYGYAHIPYWDKIMHTASGLLITAAGLAVYHMLEGMREVVPPRHRRTALAFAFFFNAGVAALWEIYEYLLLVLLGIDAVNNATTGVHDTIQDMMVCVAGGLIALFIIRRFWQGGKRSFLMETCYHFIHANARETQPNRRQPPTSR